MDEDLETDRYNKKLRGMNQNIPGFAAIELIMQRNNE